MVNQSLPSLSGKNGSVVDLAFLDSPSYTFSFVAVEGIKFGVVTFLGFDPREFAAYLA